MRINLVRFLAACSLVLCCATLGLAQGRLSVSDDALFTAHDHIPIDAVNTEDWTLFIDAELAVIYIDLAAFDVLPYSVQIRHSDGSIAREDVLAGLDHDVIYEIDLQELTAGDYDIELSSSLGTYSQHLTLLD